MGANKNLKLRVQDKRQKELFENEYIASFSILQMIYLTVNDIMWHKLLN